MGLILENILIGNFPSINLQGKSFAWETKGVEAFGTLRYFARGINGVIYFCSNRLLFI